MRRIGLLVAVGLILGGSFSACSQKVEEQPDVERLCAARCAGLYGPCYGGTDPTFPGEHEDESACTASCVESTRWTEPCRWRRADLFECTAALSCEEFRLHSGNDWAVIDESATGPRPNPDIPCSVESFEWNNCIAGVPQ